MLILAALLLAVSGLLAYGYFRYLAVQRYTVENGRLTVALQPVNGLGTVLSPTVYALYMFPAGCGQARDRTGTARAAGRHWSARRGASSQAQASVQTVDTVLAPNGKRVVTTGLVHNLPRRRRPGHAAGRARTTTVETGTPIRPSADRGPADDNVS